MMNALKAQLVVGLSPDADWFGYLFALTTLGPKIIPSERCASGVCGSLRRELYLPR